MEMFNPPHPGKILARIASNLWLDRRRRKGSAFRGVVSLLNGHKGVSADMAMRLEKAGLGSAES
jgi:plasmid maintenance system antidote protein VapI